MRKPRVKKQEARGKKRRPTLARDQSIIVVHKNLRTSPFDDGFGVWKDAHDTLIRALHDLLGFYDRVANNSGGHGWTAADVIRLEEIRKLAHI